MSFRVAELQSFRPGLPLARAGAMARGIKGVILLPAFLWFCHPAFSQGSVLTFVNEGKVFLRWTPDPASDGYNVYRGSQKLNSALLKPEMNVSAIKAQLRYKADVYLALFDAEDKEQISKTIFQQRVSDPLVGAITMVNPEFGKTLGVMFEDAPGAPATYRITTVRGGSESDWVNANVGLVTQQVPMADGLTLDCGDASVELKWNKDVELMKKGEIVSYHVYRATNLLGPYERLDFTGILPVSVSSGTQKTDVSTQSYSDSYLTNGTTYYYYITAMNAFGFESLPTATLECTPKPGDGMTAPYGLRATVVGRMVRLDWSSRLDGVSGFSVYRSTNALKGFVRAHPVSESLVNASMSWFDTDANEGGTYFYYVLSIAENGSRLSSDTMEFRYPDQTPPAPPSGVKAVIENGQIVIRWTKNTEKDIAGYEVERASDKEYKQLFRMTGSMITTNYYADHAPQQSPTKYGYVVYAFDNSNNKSAPSAMVFARMPDKTPPQVPMIMGVEIDSNVVRIEWTASPDEDFAKYKVWRYDKDPLRKLILRETRETSTLDIPPTEGNYFYLVSAVDSSGNESKPSMAMRLNYTVEISVPTPTRFSIAKNDSDHLVLTWQCIDTKTLAGFVITKENLKTGDAVMLAEIEDPKARTFTDIYADTKVSYSYTLQARDKHWRMSEEVVGSYKPN